MREKETEATRISAWPFSKDCSGGDENELERKLRLETASYQTAQETDEERKKVWRRW